MSQELCSLTHFWIPEGSRKETEVPFFHPPLKICPEKASAILRVGWTEGVGGMRGGRGYEGQVPQKNFLHEGS